MTVLLDSEEAQLAIQHALEVHALAEAERKRLRACTDLDSLRETLRECGIPDGDIDASFATLADVFAQRKLAQRRNRVWVGVGVALAALVAAVSGVAYWYATLPPPPPKVFVSVDYRNFDDAPRHSYSDGFSLSGDLEKHLAQVFKDKGVAVVEALEVATVGALYSAGRTEPPLADLPSYTGATMAALGLARCVSQGNIMDTDMLSVRSTVEIRLFALAKSKIIANASAEAVGVHINAEKGCALATKKAAAKALPDFANQSAGHRASGVGP